MIVFDTEDNSAELLAAGKSGFGKTVTQIAALDTNGHRYHCVAKPGKPINPLDFLKWCHTVEPKGNVWGFNTQYDVGNLCNGKKLHLDDFDVTLVKGRFIKGKIMGLTFLDAHNLSGTGSSVRSLGIATGLPKLGLKYSELERKHFSAARLAENDALAGLTEAERFRNPNYVFRDCEIPLAWLKFIQERGADIGIESVPATLGSLCTKAFAAMGYENWFESSEDTAQALLGARVELFSGGGRGRIAYVDINSLYPWCMTQLFPTCVERLDKLEGYGIARVEVEVPKMAIAPLPVKDEDDRLIFPVGKFGGVWTIHEIKNAVRAGARVTKIYWILGSKTGKAYYRDYITTMYENRLASQSEAEKLFWKLLMNNLYGRLAIGGVISRSLLLTDENQDEGIPYGKKILMDLNMPLPDFTNYLHAAHVLSYARIKLFSYLTSVPPESLIYCDTDSMIFFCRGNIPFPVNKDLGAMKLEAWGKRCVPYLPKTYIFDEKYKAKGVPAKRAKEFILTGRAEYDLPFKLREAIRFYEDDNSRKLSVWRHVEKIRAAHYDRKTISGKFFLPKAVNLL